MNKANAMKTKKTLAIGTCLAWRVINLTVDTSFRQQDNKPKCPQAHPVIARDLLWDVIFHPHHTNNSETLWSRAEILVAGFARLERMSEEHG